MLPTFILAGHLSNNIPARCAPKYSQIHGSCECTKTDTVKTTKSNVLNAIKATTLTKTSSDIFVHTTKASFTLATNAKKPIATNNTLIYTSNRTQPKSAKRFRAVNATKLSFQKLVYATMKIATTKTLPSCATSAAKKSPRGKASNITCDCTPGKDRSSAPIAASVSIKGCI